MIEHAIQVRTSTPGLLSRPVTGGIEFTGIVQILPRFRGIGLRVDAEFLPLLGCSDAIPWPEIGRYGRCAQTFNLPGRTVRQQPLPVFVLRETILDEQFLGYIGRVFVPTDPECLFSILRIL